jgi:hypothetical protein
MITACFFISVHKSKHQTNLTIFVVVVVVIYATEVHHLVNKNQSGNAAKFF